MILFINACVRKKSRILVQNKGRNGYRIKKKGTA